MKRFLLVLLHFSLSYAVLAQRQSSTLLDSKPNWTLSGFGGPFVELSSLRGQVLLSVGGSGAASLNDRFFFGGFGQSGTIKVILPDNGTYNAHVSQGGLWLGYIFRPYKVLHLTTDTRLGWTSTDLIDLSTHSRIDQNGYTVIPSLGAEINLSHFLRIQLTGGYRFASSFDSMQFHSLSNSDMDSFVGTLTLRIGLFR